MGKNKTGVDSIPAWGTALMAALVSGSALAGSCSARSGAAVTPVVELFTSQGCSSCPPADRWLSSLATRGKDTQPVIQAFHVAYWDYIGWVDRFAAPAHTQRQRQLAAWNGLRNIYTPQVLLDAQDWRQWHQAGDRIPASAGPAWGQIAMRQREDAVFEASVTMRDGAPASWAAYWTVTEDAFKTAVGAGENAGEQLRNDHVVRQYVPAGDYRTQAGQPQTLVLHAVPGSGTHTRAVNLVVFDPRNGRTLQALALHC